MTAPKSFLEADLLITDWSGVALEYAFGTERPVIFIDMPRKIMNEKYTELDIEPFEAYVRNKIGVVVSAEELDHLSDIVDSVIADELKYKKEIIRLRDKHIYNLRNSAAVNAEQILLCLRSI